jgi:hypothetical protein
MGKRRKLKTQVRARDLSLDEQLRELDENAPPGPLWCFDKLMPPSAERIEYVRKRQEIVDRLRRREGKRLADPGPDEGGRLAPSPYALQHGHLVEDAPKELRSSPDSSFPKRITTQRMIDRYKAMGVLTARQWRAADRLWRMWRDTGRDPTLTASYSPDRIQGSGDPDARMVGRSGAVAEFENCRRLVGVLGFGVLVDVVIWDQTAADWATRNKHPKRVSGAIGVAFLRAGLDALAKHFRY